MRKRIQRYAQDNPLSMWLNSSSILAAVYTFVLHWKYPVSPDATLVQASTARMLFVGFLALSQSTVLLLWRFSEEQRRQKPIRASQDTAVGLISAFAALISIGSFAVPIFFRFTGMRMTAAIFGVVLPLFVLSSLLSVAMGYAGRYTKWGRFGLRVAALQLAFVVLGGFTLMLVRWSHL